ncbi:M50 family metallopeptidase [Cellulomonas sp. zg-ZUI222]|uniref:M50 family metallopeptidase n=1 Tax=Cellulomonas wangleii TaxID=2816956 RepID=A0ABX8D4Y6_9CELL|nr:M50 family metallopeptidase [Cellulomonas wangleii]MBO0919355.1 M50 family metallopeptidase [Cellulomonas wangleii]MBO0924499.1 M50 family metallopeptidase [Cellulomonas wangleii]QVI62489.1 M50 family metallopeptidase [Cellulomonas wangleii]
MSGLADLWTQVTTPQPAPDRLTVAVVALVVLVALTVPGVWHLLRHGLTIVHEAAHAAVAVLVGRRLSGIRVHSDTSGLTVSRGRPRGPGMVATVAAGYPGPAVLGLAAAWLLSRGYALAVLWLLLVVVVLVLLQIRNWYGLWAVLVSGAVLVVVTVWAPAQVQTVVAAGLTWFLLLGAPRAVLEMQSQRRRVRRGGGRDQSDAGLLAGLTHLPAAAWVGLLLVLCVALLGIGGAWLLAAWPTP